MVNESNCPVCLGNDLVTIRQTIISREMPIPETAGQWRGYLQMRRRILFEVWLPETEHLELRVVGCRQCGFVFFLPRPDAADLDAKYQFLAREEGNLGGQSDSRLARRRDAERAMRILKCISRYISRSPLRVLDFGGGNGKLLHPFLASGHQCDLIDYADTPIAGVRKVGNTLEEVGSSLQYDAIICSHVLEHVAAPREVVSQLRDRLLPGGVLYAEVPSELWEGFDPSLDLVTHVNFFHIESFRALFAHTGFVTLRSTAQLGTYNGGKLDVVSVVATSTDEPRRPPDPAVAWDQTQRLLHPSARMRLSRMWRYRRMPTMKGVLRRLRKIS